MSCKKTGLSIFLLIVFILSGCTHAKFSVSKPDVASASSSSPSHFQEGSVSTSNDQVEPKTPAKIIAVSVSAFGDITVALKEDGTVWSWGDNEYGQLGDGTNVSRNTPMQVKGISNVLAIANGAGHAIALKEDGTVWAWGRNLEGEFGDGSSQSSGIPKQVIGLSEVTAIAAGDNHSLAIREDGTVWAWGDNSYTQLGRPIEDDDNGQPKQVEGIHDAKQISGGLAFSLTVLKDGELLAWGWNESIDLGHEDYLSPVDLGFDQIVQASGTTAVRVLKSDGTVWEWGYEDEERPRQVKGLNDVIAIDLGRSFNMAIKNDGTVLTWGHNDHGELGDGTTVDKDTPEQVQGLKDIIAVDGGQYHAVALQKDGTIWAWGDNSHGQLGDGTYISRSLPAKVQFE
ncbi:RCC1 domain-containing protein [Cohnella sp.]|uniref:RCC1 domain-containing protein n=1 Tax=Cohnella sp. TaxID=1883426 RepID=UPI00356474C3